MAAFIKRYFQAILLSFGLLIAFLGMIIFKSQLEAKMSATDEFYFLSFQILFIGILSYVILNWTFRKWKEYQTLKNEKIKAELYNLKNQISPHFFFNTLNNLYGLVKKDSSKAQDFILKLSDLMRYSIYAGDDEVIDIEQEINFLENFIELQKIRYHKKMDISFVHNVDDTNTMIAPLLFIVLLENAFKHGVEKLTDNIYVKVQLVVGQKLLTFTVENSFDSALVSKPGIGLNNLEKRLDLIYLNRYNYKVRKKKNMYQSILTIEL